MKKKPRKMNEWTRGTILCIAACLLIVGFAAFGIPFIKYCKAISLEKDGKIIEAYDAYIAMDGYKDSAERAAALYEQYKVEKFKAAKVGSYIYFGTYEQDNDLTNGPEDIKWRVLAIEDGKALIISRYCLAGRQYHERDEAVTWETCTLRQWLNTEFWNEAFSEKEKERIRTVLLPAEGVSANQGGQHGPTEDKVFILSVSEMKLYADNGIVGMGFATKKAIADGVDAQGSNGNCWWWTRTSGRNPNEVLSVDSTGEANMFGDNVTETYYAVRPAVWIQLGDLSE